MKTFTVHRWRRDSRNPILPPGPADFDATACMNPFVVRQGGEYFLFYAGGGRDGSRRICLATAPVDDLTSWTRCGPLFPLGEPGAFDASWCVLPCVHRFGDTWRLYYTGRNPALGEGLQGFTGIGFAESADLRTWTKRTNEPVLRGDGFDRWPENRGVAGGGRIQEVTDADGATVYRLHYTLAPGKPDPDLRVDQEKHAVSADSQDGITWFNRRIVLSPRADAPYEDAATIALNVWPSGAGWRAIYAGIGTRFGAYSICEAESRDGLVWARGNPGENLALAPEGDGWESRMVEYPHIVEEGSRLRLFYCGNGYGATGIGTAVADRIAPCAPFGREGSAS